MDIKDILTLVNAGFTAEMIAGFVQTEPKPDPKPEPKPDPKPEPKSKTEDELSEITKRLDELTKAIQSNNTVSATAPTPKENEVNDVILNLIKEV
jgi:outer membrane biosynthesis protein TonB